MASKLLKPVKEIKDKSLDNLTIKQQKWVVRFYETGNATQSALEIYDCDYNSAMVIGSENRAKLKDPIKTYMETKGISLGKLVDVLSDGLSANRVVSAMQTDKQATGATADFIEVPDHAIRHKYLETASKWLGVEATKQTEEAPANLKRRYTAEEFFEAEEK